MSAPPVGMIGLGNMGGRIVTRLLAAGHPVIGFDLRPDLSERVGAEAAGTVGEVAAAADVVFLSLPDSPAVESVIYGEKGVLASCRAGQTIVDLGTSSPDSTKQIASAFADRGVDYLDAGISGGAAAAEAGTLTLMVGGNRHALDRVRPVVDTFAAKIFHLGESGAGHTAKLLNNFLNAVSLSATAEVMVAARKAGLDLATLLDVLNASSGVNFATLNRFPKIIKGDYLEGGLTNALMMKDVVLYAELVSNLGVTSVNVSGPLAAFGLANALGYEQRISNTVVDAIGDVSGGVRLFDAEDREGTP